MKDVALKAGVSVGTVSRVINNRGSISEETRKRVFAIMKELDYQPNEMARSLQTGRSRILGLVIPYVDHPFFSALTASITRACQSRGYRLMLCTSEENTAQEQELISMLRNNQVAGVLVSTYAESAALYASFDLPVVGIERTLPDLPSVSCDNYHGGVLAAQELKAAGCKKALFWGTHAAPPYMPASQRFDGFRDECDRIGLPFTKDAVSFDVQNASTLLQKLLDRHPDADGIFVTGDVTAVRLYRELLQIGKSVPGAYKIVGFDGLELSAYFELSTIAQPIREMGEQAVDILIRRIDGQTTPNQVVFPVQLLRRSSTRGQSNL